MKPTELKEYVRAIDEAWNWMMRFVGTEYYKNVEPRLRDFAKKKGLTIPNEP